MTALALTLLFANIPFCPNTGGFDVNNAYWLAQASNIAYEAQDRFDEIKASYPQAQFQLFQVVTTPTLENGMVGVAAEALVIDLPDKRVVAFRGTESTNEKDFITDFAARKVRWEGPGYVHIGFLNFYRELWKQLEPVLQADKSRPVWVTGHSLGGAAATLFYVNLMRKLARPEWRGLELRDLYTFGSPRVGDRTFAEWVTRNTRNIYRVRNFNDPITMVPASRNVLLGGYRHVGKMIYLDSSKRILRDAVERVVGFDWIDIGVFDFWASLPQHFAKSYIVALEAQDLAAECH